MGTDVEISLKFFQKISCCKKFRGVLGHFEGEIPWTKADECCLPGVAKLVGAKSELEVAVMNSLTVNIHILFTAFYRPTKKRYKVLMEARAFPSDHYVVKSQLELHGLVPTEDALICLEPRPGEECLRTEDVLNCLDEHGETIALVFFSGIQYYTGQLFKIEAITKRAQKQVCRNWLARKLSSSTMKYIIGYRT
jgi:kynureninase